MATRMPGSTADATLHIAKMPLNAALSAANAGRC